MIPFRKVSLSDRPTIEKYLLKASAPICDATFSSLYMWQEAYNTHWAEVEGAMVVRFDLSHDGVKGYMIEASEQFYAARCDLYV